ncbi:uncharacterized protein N7484_004292 [Penicillium longicatenatum]|uniref:uncharacterized protein n=1 Tax=Penicillium longicatenatum TaxID=1561947 RepID=UPI002548E730|nr:uncharacterized protein N7484_004292 [Penicillium longicatenatum]KAJ5650569.1 hypothetical protein N7484_004292 [Penicillium longicatenatum]
MKGYQGPDKPPETPQAQFKSPSRPATRVSKSTASKRAAPPHISGSTNPHKRKSLPSSRAQSTLTQIDFVTQTTQPDNDQLDYLENSGTPANTLDQPGLINEESDDDPEYRSTLQTRPAQTIFEPGNDHPKRRRKSAGMNVREFERGQSGRKSQTPRTSVGPKGKRKPTEKLATKSDKTLTQMDFVRRYIPIDDDDDMNLGYIQPTFQRKASRNIKKEAKLEGIDTSNRPTPTSAKRNRRILEAELDLSTGEPISDPCTSQAAENGNNLDNGTVCGGPITPHKRRLEIPSSQSPESPGLAIITSSQFLSATRSPLRQKSQNFAHEPRSHIKEESPKSQQLVEDSQGQGHGSSEKTPTACSPKVLIASSQRPTFAERLASCAPSNESINTPRPPSNYHEPKRTQGERMVVYETDAESDQSDAEDNINDDPTTPSRLQESQAEDANISSAPWSPLAPSQELPSPNVQPSDNQDCDPSSEAPMSDGSVYYHRMQKATQYPHEPIPALNTQRLFELFPNEGPTQHAKPGPPPASTPSAQTFAGPFLQTQTQSQDGEEPDIVLESSPIRGQENNTEESQVVFQRPHLPESVQVESSQPIDQANIRAGKALSRSQLLTSSVMESVPLPNFWMSSQDSVGEPYTLPDQ